MEVKRLTVAVERNEMLKISDACQSKIGIRAGVEPSVKPTCSRPLIQAAIRPPVPLHAVMKKRDRGRMDDAQGGQVAKQPCIPVHDFIELITA
jgi:hypothetical protein